MMNALSKRVDPALPLVYNKSVLWKETNIYWLAYLLKKLYQQDKEGIFKMKVQGKLESYEMSFRIIVSRRIQKKAEEQAKIQK